MRFRRSVLDPPIGDDLVFLVDVELVELAPVDRRPHSGHHCGNVVVPRAQGATWIKCPRGSRSGGVGDAVPRGVEPQP